ncbi:MAG: DUF6382 domain-containing protein, partial [Lachnospiraceae bacterium]|nr:DUF6382 domain-containing protein [Lachnospiraceae bacterium]
MEIRFDRDLRHNYMVLCGLEAETDYRLRMLSENVPAGLLRCSLRNINAQIYLYYEIDSRQPMRNRYADGRLSAADLKRLLRAVLALGGTLEDYLLDIEHVLFSVDCIYVDIRTGDFFFAYCPYSGEDLGEQGKRADFASFTEDLLPFLNPSDEEAARIAYTLCGEAGNGGMLIRDMIEAALREGNAETAEALRGETGTAGAEVPPWQSGEPVRRDESGQSEIRAGLSCAEPGVNGSCASTGFHPDTIAGRSRSSVRTDGDIDRVSFSEGTEGTCDSGKSTPAGGSVREIGRFLPVVLFAAVFAANLVIRSRFYLSPEEKLLSLGVAVVSLVMAAGSL